MTGPQRRSLAERVAERSGATPAVVEAVLAAHAVPDSHVPLTDVECDAEVNGRPTGFRVAMHDGAVAGGAVLEAYDLAGLLLGGSRARTVLTAGSAAEYARAVDAFMLDRLSLEPLFAAIKTGGVQTHRWASYFGALYHPQDATPY